MLFRAEHRLRWAGLASSFLFIPARPLWFQGTSVSSSLVVVFVLELSTCVVIDWPLGWGGAMGQPADLPGWCGTYSR